jgi:steroid delta-isomerase-like uncharacterized protein
MGIEENTALIYKLYDEYNKGNYDYYDECFSDDFVAHRPGGPLNKNGYKEFLVNISGGFPDIHRTIHEVIVTEDKAALYYTWTGTDKLEIGGRTPTGKRIRVKEIIFMSFKDGKISEFRPYGDQHSMLHQLGMPLPEE